MLVISLAELETLVSSWLQRLAFELGSRAHTQWSRQLFNILSNIEQSFWSITNLDVYTEVRGTRTSDTRYRRMFMFTYDLYVRFRRNQRFPIDFFFFGALVVLLSVS